ncbi:hypothetical protein GmHk_03G006794 [Glycine max]|nr:hypothetical protein GmHk_03G006794 [Glycine max]
MTSFSQMQSQFRSQMQSQGLALPLEPLIGPSGPRVSTKESCVDPSGNNPETGDSDRCGLYIEAKVGVEEIKNPDVPVPVPTDEAIVSPKKPPQNPDPKVDDLLYLMTLTIPELLLRPYQVTWDATVFGVFNPNFSLYIKHEELSKIVHGGQCLSILVHLTQTSIRSGNSDLYGFLEPQSIQRSGQSQFEAGRYIKSWMQSSKHNVYLGAYLNGALKGLDDAPQPKSKTAARWIVVKCEKLKELGVPELLSAMAAGWNTKFIVESWSYEGRFR